MMETIAKSLQSTHILNNDWRPKNIMTRPAHLPEFSDPPLDELVLGLQFESIAGYTSVLASGIWQLFREEYPVVQEHPPLEPAFETFGGGYAGRIQFSFGAPRAHTRLWFISGDEGHLLQFQPDRFLINWRRRPNGKPYPRFDSIFDQYTKCFEKLTAYLGENGFAGLRLNQAEVTYINIIPAPDYSSISDWLRPWVAKDISMDAVNFSFTEVQSDGEGRPFARLHHDLSSVMSIDGKAKAFRFGLTFRGAPRSQQTSNAFDLLRLGRSKIVERFTSLTTESAHRLWSRTQ